MDTIDINKDLCSAGSKTLYPLLDPILSRVFSQLIYTYGLFFLVGVIPMKAGQLMTDSYKVLEYNELMHRAISDLEDSGDTMVVMQGKKYKGIISERDLLRIGIDPEKTRIKNFLYNPPKIEANTGIEELFEIMLQYNVTKLPVYHDGIIKGVVDAMDILRTINRRDEVLVSTVMSKKIITAHPDDPISNIVNILTLNQISRVPITEKEDLMGIISVHDIMKCLERMGTEAYEMKASEVMNFPVETIRCSRKVSDATNRMDEQGIGSLIVVKEGSPVGIVSRKDLIRSYLEAKEADINVQITSKLEELDKSMVFEEINSFIDKNRQQLGNGLICAYFGKENSDMMPLVTCRLRFCLSNMRINLMAQDRKGQNAVRDVLRKAKASVIKLKETRRAGILRASQSIIA